MKKQILYFFIAGCLGFYMPYASSLTSQELFFSLTASSTWREFKAAPAASPRYKKSEKRVLIGEIKLKSKDTIFLDALTARWCGKNIGKLVASLYSKKITDPKAPVPIDDNLICDGAWNSKTKEFIFPVNKKLVASDTYYLMVHVPSKYEKQLRSGSFEIIKEEKRALLSLKNR